MGKSPSQFEETIQHQFDRLCKLALKGEKIDYIRHFMGMSDAEIARKMKLVRSTVNEHRKRSLEILKDVMEEKADESEM